MFLLAHSFVKVGGGNRFGVDCNILLPPQGKLGCPWKRLMADPSKALAVWQLRSQVSWRLETLPDWSRCRYEMSNLRILGEPRKDVNRDQSEWCTEREREMDVKRRTREKMSIEIQGNIVKELLCHTKDTKDQLGHRGAFAHIWRHIFPNLTWVLPVE